MEKETKPWLFQCSQRNLNKKELVKRESKDKTIRAFEQIRNVMDLINPSNDHLLKKV